MHNVWFKVWSCANGATSGPAHGLELELAPGRARQGGLAQGLRLGLVAIPPPCQCGRGPAGGRGTRKYKYPPLRGDKRQG